MWAAASNPFLSTAIRVQEDRRHHVVVARPYRLVRRLMCFGLCLLGWRYLVTCSGTGLEDRTLRAELPGHKEYTHRTRYCLVPGVW
jgi:protein-S-isoprenylcysteine O-methyltransferase Ste14